MDLVQVFGLCDAFGQLGKATCVRISIHLVWKIVMS